MIAGSNHRGRLTSIITFIRDLAPDHARRLLHVAAEPAQRGGRIEIDMRHMSEPRQ